MQDACEIRRQPKTAFVAGHSHRYRVWPCMDALPSVSDSVKERDAAAFLNAFTNGDILQGMPHLSSITSSLNSAVLRVNGAISNTRDSNLAVLIFPVATQPGEK